MGWYLSLVPRSTSIWVWHFRLIICHPANLVPVLNETFSLRDGGSSGSVFGHKDHHEAMAKLLPDLPTPENKAARFPDLSPAAPALPWACRHRVQGLPECGFSSQTQRGAELSCSSLENKCTVRHPGVVGTLQRTWPGVLVSGSCQ